MSRVSEIRRVNELGEGFDFVSDSQDVLEICEHLGREVGSGDWEFDSFFVKVSNGDYERVYGMRGIVPHNLGFVYRLI